MRYRKLIIILGLWVIALAFLGFSDSLLRILLVTTGVLLSIIGFKRDGIVKSQNELMAEVPQQNESPPQAS